MRDFTKDSILRHILSMTAPAVISTLTQVAYQLINLYFVARLGLSATAAVNAAANVGLVVAALMQVLGIGTVVAIAHAVGRKDERGANLVFNQSMVLSLICGATTVVLILTLIHFYLRSVVADAETIRNGVAYTIYALPAYGLSMPMAVLSNALRGTGVVAPTIMIWSVTAAINAILAPILIAGWGIDLALGVSGAGLATSISTAIGMIFFWICLICSQRYLKIRPGLMYPQFSQWRRVLSIGLPAGIDFVLFFLYAALVYQATRNFGTSAQAGFGIGSTVMQTILVPGVSIAAAAAPIAGQNFGANEGERVRDVFRMAAAVGTLVMILVTLVSQWWPSTLVSVFHADAAALGVASVFLELMSWAFVSQGLVQVCSSMFQGLGNTLPAVISSSTRFAIFAVSLFFISGQDDFHLEQIWYISVFSITAQAMTSLWLLRIEFRKRL